MANRTTTLSTFTVEPSRAVPTAAVNPPEVSRVIGALVKLDGRASVGDSELTYAWSFSEVPLGSTVTSLVSIEEDDSVVTFVPDMTGRYVVGLVVSTPYRSSEMATATVDMTSVQVPLLLRTTPDGEIMFRVISSFWKMVEKNAVFSTLWSGYMQLAGTDLLRLWQADRGKSIATVQELTQRRWISYAPELLLDSALVTGVFGSHQGGSGAFTTSGSVASTGVAISATEVVLMDGAPVLDAIGTELAIYTSNGGNTGSYLINRLNSDDSGYILSPSTPLPDWNGDVLASGTTLVTFAASTTVYDSDGGADFETAGVEVGDVLRIASGSDAGYYRVDGVGIMSGLANDRTLLLDRAPTQTASGRTYTVFNLLRIAAERAPAAATNTVYVPESEGDLSAYDPRTLEGGGSITRLYEIVVESRHIFPGMVGQKLSVTSGSTSSRSYTITGLNAAGTGYLVGAAFSVTSFPTTVTYSLASSLGPSARLLVLEDEAYAITSILLDDGTDVEDGGRGALWVVTLASATAPVGREGMEWRIAAALTTTEVLEDETTLDFEAAGVTAGDLLVLDVVRSDTGFVGRFPCTVLGAVGSTLAFDFGTDGSWALTDAETLDIADGLKIPRVYVDEADETQVTLLADEVRAFVRSATFTSTYGNLPITAGTVFDLDGNYLVRLRVRGVVRNTRVPVDDTLVSVPALFEYIDTPQTGVRDDGTIVLVGKYGDAVELDREPLEFVENRDYSLSSGSSTKGTNLETVAGSTTLRIPGGSLIDRDLRVGDYVEVTSGFDQDRYYVRSVVDDERVIAVTATGDVPATTASGLSYVIRRRTAGNFLRFVDGMFTAAVPAPNRFWAQLSLYDNYQTIEDNFGVMVGVTKAQLDEYGSSQVSYRGAVTALMYAWTMGPTVRNVGVGTHVLMGLPVTEVRGRILQVDTDYDTANARGRVLIEDLDRAGNGTNVVRIYYFQTDVSSGLSDFQGLATNPLTGRVFDVLDDVPAFTPISRGIIVSDYLTAPLWWKGGSSTGGDELQKFHTWQVEVDAAQVDSRDMPLITDFCSGIRPIYTKPHVVLVLYLLDEVTVTDDLVLAGTWFLNDDPVLSVEATHMVDDENGSSLPTRILDRGSFATRTLFEGVDLVTTAGSGVVTSVRGGFANALAATPTESRPDEAVGELPGVNAFFPDAVLFRGSPLVRAGDVLFIRSGNNRGRYVVLSVDSDTQLTVDELPDYPPTTRPVAEIEEATDQVFQVQRLDSAVVTSGVATFVSTSGSGASASTVIENEDGNFRWEGVAVGDVLVVTTGADYGRHRVLQVGTWDLGDIVDRDTRLIVAGALSGDPLSYVVEREHLRVNPVWSFADLVTTAASDTVTSVAGGLALVGLPHGAVLTLLTGTDAGREIEILDATDDSTLVLRETLTASETVSAVIILPERLTEDGVRDADWDLERLCALDEPLLVIVRPRTFVTNVADLLLENITTAPDPADWYATATSATDLEAAGVSAGAFMDVANAAFNSGTRVVTSVAGTVVAIEGLWRSDETVVEADFYTDAADWEVLDDTATLGSVVTLEDIVIPGDVFVFSVGTFVVRSISTNVLTLTRDTGVGIAAFFTGRVERIG